MATFVVGGCGGSSSPAFTGHGSAAVATLPLDPPVLLGGVTQNGDPLASEVQCTEPHTVCMTVHMPDTIPGDPTHLAVAYYKAVPVMVPAGARAVLQAPALKARDTFRIKAQDGGLTGQWYPVVLVYMPGGGEIIAVDNLDYTAEAPHSYDLTGAPLNLSEDLVLIFGL